MREDSDQPDKDDDVLDLGGDRMDLASDTMDLSDDRITLGGAPTSASAPKRMSARVAIARSETTDVQIELRQSGAEVARFLLFVALVLWAVYGLIPGAREAPGVLLAVLGVAVGWSATALVSQEVYDVDGMSGTIRVLTNSPLGTRRRQFPTADVVAVRLTLGGPDDNRRLVELIGRSGEPRLRLPRRMTTLSARDQMEIGGVLAETLGVPLRYEMAAGNG